MSTRFTLWCESDEDGGPEVEAIAQADGVPGLRLDPSEWTTWLEEHRHHEMSLVVQVPAGPLGLPFFRVNRGGITFEVPEPDAVECATAWSDYRKEYGVSVSRSVREQEHEAFKAGWAAARGTADTGGVQR